MSRSSYQQKLRDQLESWQRKIDQLAAHSSQAGVETRRRFEDQIQDLRAKQRAARRKLDQIERAGKSLRGRAGSGLATTRRKMHRAVKRITSGFR